MKYLVMECHEDYAILLDEEAAFVKAKNTGLTMGETTENPQLLKASPSRRNIIMKVTSAIAAAAACFAVVLGVNHYNEYMTPYSNIRFSINPDVELVLNHHGQVLSVKGLNEDGEKLIDGYSPKRQDKLVVADELIERAIEMGYLSDNSVIIFDIDTPDKKLLTQYGIELRSEAAIYTREFDNVNIIITDRNQDTSDDYEYSDKDYEPVVIPVPQQTEETNEPETKPPVTKPIASDSGYEENDDGESRYVTDNGESHYGTDDGETQYEDVPTEAVRTNPPTTAPPSQQNTVVNADSNYDSGESSYDAGSNYGSSGYYTDD